MKSILTSAVARGRENLAQGFAFDTDIAAEMAIALLAKAPVAAPPAAATSGLLDEMSAMQHANIGAAPPASSAGNDSADKYAEGAAAARSARNPARNAEMINPHPAAPSLCGPRQLPARAR
jgi:hypothetical protein